jgi:vacuolar-type H+-ATPase subunit H
MTSIEWLASKLSVTFNTMYAEEIEQAKKMHKQEIEEAWVDGALDTNAYSDYAEQYYQKTFKQPK